MGGHDPYSSSKGAAELVISAYRNSYFSETSTFHLNFNQRAVLVASARAGNVIGGGDWALDRIIPDCIRQLTKGEPIAVRNKAATRPWQHVLEPLSGYLALASRLAGTVSGNGSSSSQTAIALPVSGAGTKSKTKTINSNTALEHSLASLCSAFNFGPALTSNRTVADLVQEVLKHWEGRWDDVSDPNAPHEAKLLSLSIDKAFHLLDWTPCWDFEETVKNTISWYRDTHTGAATPVEMTQRQIADYTSAAREQGVKWAQ